MIQSKKLARFAFSCLKKGDSSEKVLRAVKDVLIQNKQESLYGSFLKNLQKLVEKQNQYETFFIESPFPLSAEMQNTVIRSVTDESVSSVLHKENKDLLLGFRALYKGTIFDGSAKKYITNLKKLSR
jgi:F0F1-type ATP synthase delta subunit